MTISKIPPRMKSIAGIVCYVKNIQKTANFYEALGFQFSKRETDHISIHLNWFWIDFHSQDKEDKPEFQIESLSFATLMVTN